MSPLLLTFDDVCQITQLGRTSIRKLMKQNKFPAQIDVGVNVPLWRHNDVRDWADRLPTKE